ncbi:MAG: DUF3105 domain-containing protein [Chloroflexi bacterium]|nr:MAG: DUF3105 domain-containing protein [Chloroflexota bacterium]
MRRFAYISTAIIQFERGSTAAYPWPPLDVPVVLTSWGRIQKFETFDPEQAKVFYRANLNRAPEPNAP